MGYTAVAFADPVGLPKASLVEVSGHRRPAASSGIEDDRLLLRRHHRKEPSH